MKKTALFSLIFSFHPFSYCQFHCFLFPFFLLHESNDPSTHNLFTNFTKMHFPSLAAIALAIAPVAVSAAGTLGFALGDKMPDGSCKTTSDYETDFDRLLTRLQVGLQDVRRI